MPKKPIALPADDLAFIKTWEDNLWHVRRYYHMNPIRYNIYNWCKFKECTRNFISIKQDGRKSVGVHQVANIVMSGWSHDNKGDDLLRLLYPMQQHEMPDGMTELRWTTDFYGRLGTLDTTKLRERLWERYPELKDTQPHFPRQAVKTFFKEDPKRFDECLSAERALPLDNYSEPNFEFVVDIDCDSTVDPIIKSAKQVAGVLKELKKRKYEEVSITCSGKKGFHIHVKAPTPVKLDERVKKFKSIGGELGRMFKNEDVGRVDTNMYYPRREFKAPYTVASSLITLIPLDPIHLKAFTKTPKEMMEQLHVSNVLKTFPSLKNRGMHYQDIEEFLR